MTAYFTTDPTARVSFWDNKVEHTVTADGLEIGDSRVADDLVDQGVLRVGKGTKDTPQALVYDPEKDESLAYNAAQEAAQSPVPDPEPEPSVDALAAAAAEAERQAAEEAAAAAANQSASSSGDTPASQPTGPDASQKEKRT